MKIPSDGNLQKILSFQCGRF